MIGGVAELLGPDADPAQEAVRRVLGGERDAAEHLHGAVCHLPRAAGDVRLGDRRGLRGLRIAVVERRRRVAHRGPSALPPDISVGEDVAQGLKAPDGTAELSAVTRVAAGQVEDVTRRADGLGGGEQRARGHQAAQDLPRLRSAEHTGAGHRDRVEAGRPHQHRLVEALLRPPREPGRARGHDRKRGLAVEHGEDR